MRVVVHWWVQKYLSGAFFKRLKANLAGVDRPIDVRDQLQSLNYHFLWSQVLVLEEEEFFPAPLLDKTEQIFREVMGATTTPEALAQPWGGIQIIANSDPRQAVKMRFFDEHADHDAWLGYDGSCTPHNQPGLE